MSSKIIGTTEAGDKQNTNCPQAGGTEYGYNKGVRLGGVGAGNPQIYGAAQLAWDTTN